MKLAICAIAAGMVVAISTGPVQAFGRGGAVRGAAVGPGGGVRTGGAARGVATGPYGGVRGGNVHGGTYSGPGGATVQHVGGRGAAVGPYGGVRAGGGGATRVTGPGGNSYTTGHRGGVAVGPAGGVRAGGAAGAAVNGPAGAAAVGRRGGVAVGPYGGVAAGGAARGAAVGPYGGYAAGGVRRGAVAGPYGGYAAGGVRVGAVGHYTGYVSPVAVRGAAVGIRATPYPYFSPTWYRTHAVAWVAPRYVVGAALWAPPVWNTVSTFVGVSAPPVEYDYGSTVVIQNDNVYVNGESAGTATEYATQATSIADAGRAVKPAENDEWQPLGVFGLIQSDEKVAQRIVQIAVNKDGVLRGNYYDAVADNTLQVYGSVDKKTQRVAWSIGEKKDIVFETGLNNLTKDESTILVHYGKESTQQMILVRLPEPKDEKQ